MSTIEQSIELDVPVSTAYDQWTQFEEFPTFMEGVKEVKQIDDTHLKWVVERGGQKHEFVAEITEQRPDERIAWHATAGLEHAGVVTFHRLDDAHSKVMVQMDWKPKGALESAGAALGQDARLVKGDLERFKERVERGDTPSGSWRETVEHPGEGR